jgi:hypothetical protein
MSRLTPTPGGNGRFSRGAGDGPVVVPGVDGRWYLRVGADFDRGHVTFWVLSKAEAYKDKTSDGWYATFASRDLEGGISDGRYEGLTEEGADRSMIVSTAGGETTVELCHPTSGNGKKVTVDSKQLADAIRHALDRLARRGIRQH